MKKNIKNVFRKIGLEITKYVPDNKADYVSLKPEKKPTGNVLISYIIEPFLLKDGESIPTAHTHYWESFQIAQTFLDLGYCVDVVHYKDSKFIPNKNYSFFIGARTNFQRIARLLKKDCLKIVHLDTAHWLFNNTASYKRCLALQQRKGITSKSFKLIEANWAIEAADCATVLGNEFTVSTYSFVSKTIYSISIPTVTTYPWPENKNYEKSKNHFLWIGSDGLVHKGLDLVLDAFSEMPDYHLTVCGPIQKDKDFDNDFHKELYQTPNIHTVGWTDVNSSDFINIANRCIGLIYPSCSEGQSGAVATCLQAGLIPIVSYESGVDVDDFGVMLKNCSINEIKDSVMRVSNLPVQELTQRSRKAWESARSHHTRERFAEDYRKIIERIRNDRVIQDISTERFTQNSSHLISGVK